MGGRILKPYASNTHLCILCLYSLRLMLIEFLTQQTI
uniref:Uncharacterized protein n=1 Tax=Nelumbo nucifera TaxID=4432 RepID=A0A822ZR92_NELNU|nr:TPA_asm: hypothetical protein HUJ06_017699 [Nelumbo nucifera]